MNIRETVFEYWPELSRSWHSATAAIRHYSMKGGAEALEDEVRAANILRKAKGDNPAIPFDPTPQNESWRKAGMAVEEIRRLGDIGHSVDEIIDLTRATADYVTGLNDGAGWAYGSVMRQLSHDAPARLNQEVPDPVPKLYPTTRTPAQERRVQEVHSRERARA